MARLHDLHIDSVVGVGFSKLYFWILKIANRVFQLDHTVCAAFRLTYVRLPFSLNFRLYLRAIVFLQTYKDRHLTWELSEANNSTKMFTVDSTDVRIIDRCRRWACFLGLSGWINENKSIESRDAFISFYCSSNHHTDSKLFISEQCSWRKPTPVRAWVYKGNKLTFN